jgi:tRNA uridine 5-carboxymethylaminomethyl modification enzyme
MFRLKTGTPMRLDKHTIDWDAFSPQPGDDEPVPFSFRTCRPLENKIVCYLGYTNARTHEIIRMNLDKSPLYSGIITGIGPRYCPSIEDKVVKFPDRLRHQFFLEPEGLDTTETYVNGLSSSLPYEVQAEALRSIPGLDRAKILRPAYGIEYDAVSPKELRPNLEVNKIENLFLAGQINGTSGYEEAAAQGIMAGINAALKIKGNKPLVLGRDEAYIGVLIDDLVNKGVEEPYRLFTSRAEFRLNLRIDNADQRLIGYGHRLGLIGEDDHQRFLRKQEKINSAMVFLQNEKIRLENGEKVSLKEWLKKPHIRWKDVLEYRKSPMALTSEETRHIEAEAKYEGYLQRQAKEVEIMNRVDKLRVPSGFEFDKVAGLTREAVEKLEKSRPRTLGEAKKIPGLTPAALVNLYLCLKPKKRRPEGIKCST